VRSIVLSRHGGPEALEIVERPDPTPTSGQIKVRITHVGLNHLDIWVRRGVEGHRFPLPLVPGSDAVGVREDTGETVALVPFTACRSCARCLEGRHDLCRKYHIRGEGIDGFCAESVWVDAHDLLPCPLPPEQAAALPLALLTAWHALVGVARPGDRVLVQGGAGGVGSLAIQVAVLLGARVAATASTEPKRALCRSLGAELVVGYDDAGSAIKAWSPEGVDVVVDSNGGLTWRDSLRAIRWGGTYVTYGATAGHRVELDLRALFFKQLTLVGRTMGSAAEMHRAWSAAVGGRIRPVVDRILPMSRIAEAHAAIEGRAVAGKIVLVQNLTDERVRPRV
jgi:NADPH:quinone reductase-like Zn-dependent oxidoreductase